MKYPLLHHANYLAIGILSVPLIFSLLFYYFSVEVFFSFFVGTLAGIGANETWFRLIDKNFYLYRKIMRSRRGYRKVIAGSIPLFILYAISCLLSTIIFFSWGFAAFLALISGLCLTGLMYYGSEKKFYNRL